MGFYDMLKLLLKYKARLTNFRRYKKIILAVTL